MTIQYNVTLHDHYLTLEFSNSLESAEKGLFLTKLGDYFRAQLQLIFLWSVIIKLISLFKYLCIFDTGANRTHVSEEVLKKGLKAEIR